MDDAFKIYIEQLREGRTEHLHETLNPDFLELQESDLAFKKSIELRGEAYLAEQELILHWQIQSEALIPCVICNQEVRVPIEIKDFYYSEPIEEIKSGIYNFKALLRETILLEVPPFAECGEGNCPKRQEYAKYLKDSSSRSDQEGNYHPFTDLDWKS